MAITNVHIVLGYARNQSLSGGSIPVFLGSDDSISVANIAPNGTMAATSFAATEEDRQVYRVLVEGDDGDILLAAIMTDPSTATKFLRLPVGQHEFGCKKGEKFGCKV